MSKASEWARLADSVQASEIKPFEARTLKVGVLESVNVCAAVSRRGPAPFVSITDGRLGGLYLDDTTACDLAHWILATFDESPRP